MTSGLYQIKNTNNGYVYIGASMNIERRLDAHRYALYRGKHSNTLLQEAWNKDGASAFEFSVLEQIDSVDEIQEREHFHLRRLFLSTDLNPAANYNLTYSSGFQPRRKRTRTASAWRV